MKHRIFRCSPPAKAVIVILAIASLLITAAAALTAEQGPPLVPGETLRGAAVRTPAGTRVGTVAAVLFEVGSGRVGYLLVAAEKPADRKIAVPWRAVRLFPGGEIVLAVDAEHFRLAPFDESDLGRPGSAQAIHEYFGVSPHWQDAPAGPPRPPSAPRGLRIVR